jgi:aminoglycoside phosphotransferase (APT) family kinase protein
MLDALPQVRRAGNVGVRSPWSPDRAAGRPALLPAAAGKGCSQGARPAIVNENARQSGLPRTVAGSYSAAATLTLVIAVSTEADSRHAPDPRRLDAWMAGQVPGYAGPLQVRALEGGQSNPTFRITATSGEYVLRRKPLGTLLASAHQVEREFRVIGALAGTDVPVPRVYALCEDDAVIGSTFYVMAFVPGRVFFDPRLPGLSAGERAAIFDSMNRTVAALHRIDPAAVGLGDFGRPANYLQRQMVRWSKQYRLAETDPIPAMDRLIEWLPARLPESGAGGIVHGDLRLDNMLIHPTEPRVVAVLDWELSTLGDPLSDFAHHALTWRIEPDLFRGLAGVDIAALGIPDEESYAAAYFARSGRAAPADWEVYLVFNLFRLAAIIQGIAKRAAEGTAADAEAAALGRKARPIAERAWELAERVSFSAR